VVVIGSGATTATLVPAIADRCGHVTVLQRSPTYFYAGPNANELADMLRQLDLPDEWVHEIVRRKLLFDSHALIQLSLDEPELVRDELIRMVAELLPEGYDVATHFTPRYDPWRQRVAFVPDGDLFAGISAGQATMVTDVIDHFVEDGIVLASGDVLHADVVITATGFDLCVLGDIDVAIDGEPLDLADTVSYRGMLFTGVPNMAWVFGYFRASWTLRADLVCDFVCRLLDHMDELGAHRVTPSSVRRTSAASSAPGSTRTTSTPATSGARCTCCRAASPRRSGSTARTTGRSGRRFRPPTSTTAACASSERRRGDGPGYSSAVTASARMPSPSSRSSGVMTSGGRSRMTLP